MRPPLNAGENCGRACRAGRERPGFNEAPAERGGKPGGRVLRSSGHRASMRPPLNAGENIAPDVASLYVAYASMRPPLNAGENAARRRAGGPPSPSFNEAPAERGGKLANRSIEGGWLVWLQ